MKIDQDIEKVKRDFWGSYEELKRISLTTARQILNDSIEYHREKNSPVSFYFLQCSPVILVETLSAIFKDLAIRYKKEQGIGEDELPKLEFLRVPNPDQKMPGINE